MVYVVYLETFNLRLRVEAVPNVPRARSPRKAEGSGVEVGV